MPHTARRAKKRRTRPERPSPRPAPSSRWGAFAISSLIVLHLGFLWRAAFLRACLIHGDICYFFDPAKTLLHESLRAGRLPLWSPYIFCGYPIAAEGQIAAFYPPSLLISWLLPSPAAISWLLISHLILAAVSSYLLARLLGLHTFAAWLSAVTFSFSGYLFAHLQHVSLICASAWLPLTILFVERAARGRLLPNAPLAALTWSAAALCGHPQTLFLTSLAVVFWIAWQLPTWLRKREPRALRRAFSILAITFVLGFGIAAVQLLLTADLASAAPHGDRGDLSYITSFSLLPRHFLGLVAPNWQGTPAYDNYRGEQYYWEYVLYIGLIPLVLGVIGLPQRRARRLAVLALLALLLALARGNPAYQLLALVPGFADFRVPARFILLFTFAASLLAGYGCHALSRLRVLAVRRRLLLAGGLIAAASLLDLLYFARPLVPLADQQLCTARVPPAVEALQQHSTWGRALIQPPDPIRADWLPTDGWAQNPDGCLEARSYLPGSAAQSFNLHTIGGYAGFVDPNHEPFFLLALQRARERRDLRLLSLVGTRWLLLPPKARPLGERLAEEAPFTIYRNPDAFPRVFLVGEVIAAPDPQSALQTTLELAVTDRLRGAAVVEGRFDEQQPEPLARASLTTEEPRPEHIVVQADTEADSFLVLTERWDPGWTARLDGRSVPLYAVDTVLMGAALPKGDHTLEFIYRPRGLIVGRAVSAAALALCALLILVPLLRPRKDC